MFVEKGFGNYDMAVLMVSFVIAEGHGDAIIGSLLGAEEDSSENGSGVKRRKTEEMIWLARNVQQ